MCVLNICHCIFDGSNETAPNRVFRGHVETYQCLILVSFVRFC